MIEYEITATHADGQIFETKTMVREIKDAFVRELEELGYSVSLFKRVINLK